MDQAVQNEIIRCRKKIERLRGKADKQDELAYYSERLEGLETTRKINDDGHLQSIIEQHRQKIARLEQRGVTPQDDAHRYWVGRLRQWQAFAQQVQSLDCSECVVETSVELNKTIAANGATAISARCFACGADIRGKGKWISQKIIPQAVLKKLLVLNDYRGDNPPCAVCGTVGTELHHWAPRELFPDTCEDWPKSYLCDTHHKEWHNKVTNPLRELRKEAASWAK